MNLLGLRRYRRTPPAVAKPVRPVLALQLQQLLGVLQLQPEQYSSSWDETVSRGQGQPAPRSCGAALRGGQFARRAGTSGTGSAALLSFHVPPRPVDRQWPCTSPCQGWTIQRAGPGATAGRRYVQAAPALPARPVAPARTYPRGWSSIDGRHGPSAHRPYRSGAGKAGCTHPGRPHQRPNLARCSEDQLRRSSPLDTSAGNRNEHWIGQF